MLKIGTQVRVIKNGTGDSTEVAGRIGKVISIDENGAALIFFPRWKEGHGGEIDGTGHWYVDSENLRVVTRKPKKNRKA